MHGAIDKLLISSRFRSLPKHFRDGCDSPPVADHLRAVRLRFPPIVRHGTYDVEACGLAGKLTAGFRLLQWAGSNQPTVIYHHDAADIPYDYRLGRILPHHKRPVAANLFAVRAPYHLSLSDFSTGIATVNRYLAMLAASVCVIEQLVRFNKERDVNRVIVVGLGLGGFIANLHHIIYHSADCYVPLLAGLAGDDVLLDSALASTVADQAIKERRLAPLLNFHSQFNAWSSAAVHPVLARCDQIYRFQVQKTSYGRCPVTVINRGHITGSLSFRLLRSLLYDHLRQRRN